jgi:CheY-like chemotaxis protein
MTSENGVESGAEPDGGAPARPTAGGPTVARAPKADRAAARPVVLVAEDDADMRDALADLLRATLGARVVAVASAREALAVLRDAPPDLAVLDAGLPGQDGWALARALKADPETARVPLVGLSGIGADGGALARAAGFDAYLGKERIGQLAAVVRDLLRPVLAA